VNHWTRPSCDSRTGAAHLSRGAPCQDASGILGFRDAAGSPVQVLVVSDGHGGARYVRSDVGARLACAVAMRELENALAPARVAHPGVLEDWRQRLTVELPGRIVAAWRREVEAHWRSDPGGDGSPFSPLLYGATLGVLLVTPRWWAHTGLGDWDLVRIEAAAGDASDADAHADDQPAGEALLSEEPERGAAGEATFSLCLEAAERHFAARTVLQPLTGAEPPFALLLCSDGLRKSCGSDADFLTLSRYLVGLGPDGDQTGSPELAEALDHISRRGSGDDISVAVARWTSAQQAAAWPPPGDRQPAQLVQPRPAAASAPPQPTRGSVAAAPDQTTATLAAASAAGEPEAAGPGPAGPGAARARSLIGGTASAGIVPERDVPAGDVSAGRGRAGTAAAGTGIDPSRPGSPPAGPFSALFRSAQLGMSPDGRTPSRRSPRSPRRPLWLAGALLVLSGAGLLIITRPGFGPLASRRQPALPVLTPQQRSDLQRQLQALCAVPASSAAGLQRVGAAAASPSGGGSPGTAGGSSAAGDMPFPVKAGTMPPGQGRGLGGAVRSHQPSPAGAAVTEPPRGPAPDSGTAARQPAGGGRDNRAVKATAGGALPPNPGEASAASGPSSSGISATGPVVAAASPTAQVSDPRLQQRIAATLASRASVFRRLQGADAALIMAALQRSKADPLSALIAFSASDPSLRPEALPTGPVGWLQGWSRRLVAPLSSAMPYGQPSAASVAPLAELGACPELLQALRVAWRRPGGRGAAPPLVSVAAPAPSARDGAAGPGQAGSSPAPARTPASPQPALPFR